MKWTLLPALLLGMTLTGLRAAEPWEAAYATLLNKYATPQGVRYAAWKQSAADLEALAALTRQIASSGPTTPGRNGQLAYLTNAYNIWTLHGVLEKYPIESVRDVAPLFGFFTQSRITVAGEKMSLNKLEKEHILKKFQEPRVHFALNCASVSCPPLRAEPYTASRLDAQLDDATRHFLNTNPHALQPSSPLRRAGASWSPCFSTGMPPTSKPPADPPPSSTATARQKFAKARNWGIWNTTGT